QRCHEYHHTCTAERARRWSVARVTRRHRKLGVRRSFDVSERAQASPAGYSDAESPIAAGPAASRDRRSHDTHSRVPASTRRARLNGIQEVTGSIPVRSTKSFFPSEIGFK